MLSASEFSTTPLRRRISESYTLSAIANGRSVLKVAVSNVSVELPIMATRNVLGVSSD